MEGMEGGEGSQAAVRHRGGEELIKACDDAAACCHQSCSSSFSPVPRCCPLPATAPSLGMCQLCPVAPGQLALHLSVHPELRVPATLLPACAEGQ